LCLGAVQLPATPCVVLRLSCAYSYARQPREAGRMGTSLGRAYLWTYESQYDVNLRKFMTKRAALRICGQIMYGSSGYDTIQVRVEHGRVPKTPREKTKKVGTGRRGFPPLGEGAPEWRSVRARSP